MTLDYLLFSAGEARSFAAEASLESMESELEEANAIATASNHKFEDVTRKLKVVEGDLERIIERAEEFEAKTRDIETQGQTTHLDSI